MKGELMLKLILVTLGTGGAFIVSAYFSYKAYEDKTSLDGIKLILATGVSALAISAVAYFLLSF